MDLGLVPGSLGFVTGFPSMIPFLLGLVSLYLGLVPGVVTSIEEVLFALHVVVQRFLSFILGS